MEFHTRIQVSASYTTDTERGFIAREVEAMGELSDFIVMAPNLRPMIRGQVRYPSLQGAREGLDTALRTICFRSSGDRSTLQTMRTSGIDSSHS